MYVEVHVRRRVSAEGIAGKCLKLSDLFDAKRLKGSGLDGLAAAALSSASSVSKLPLSSDEER